MSEHTPDPGAAAPGPRPGRGRKITVATIAALGLTAGGVAIAEAASASGSSGTPSSSSSSAGKPANAPKPPAAPSKYDLDGTVTAVSSDSITVRSLDGTSRTYTITDDTTVHRGPTKSSASGLANGDHVGVRGAKSGSGYTAKDIDVRLAHIDGAVKSISGDTLTITDPDGFTRTIALTSSTTYTKDGKSSSRSALTTGSLVHAEGKVDTDGTTLDASHVELGTKAARPGGPMGGPPAPPAGAPAPGKNGTSGSGGKGGKGTNGTPPAPPKAGSGAPSGKASSAPSSAPSGGSGSGS